MQVNKLLRASGNNCCFFCIYLSTYNASIFPTKEKLMCGIPFMALLCKIPAHQRLTFRSTPSLLCFSLFTWHYLEKKGRKQAGTTLMQKAQNLLPLPTPPLPVVHTDQPRYRSLPPSKRHLKSKELEAAGPRVSRQLRLLQPCR